MKKCYTESQFISFVEKVFGEGKTAGGNNIQVLCPRCKEYKKTSPYHKRKLAIQTVEPHIVHCWVCGLSGKNIYNIIKKYSPENLPEYKERFFDAEELSTGETKKDIYEPVLLPAGFTPLAKVLHRSNRKNSGLTDRYIDQALDYLQKKRGIRTEEELWYWKLGITDTPEARCKYRIIIPSFDANGSLSYWTGRSWLKKPQVVYKNPYCNRKEIIFNENNIDWNNNLTIVEGPFDLFKANQNAAPILGSEDMTLDFALMRKIVLNKTPVTLAFDPEPPAQRKQFKLANRLLEFDISVKILEYKNTEQDIGEMEKNEFSDLLKNAKLYTHEYGLIRKIGSILR